MPVRRRRAGRRPPQPCPGGWLLSVPPACGQRAQKGPSMPTAPLGLAASPTPLLLSEQLTEERLAAQDPTSVPGFLCGQCGLGYGEWAPLFVSTEKVLTRFRSHRHGNRARQSLKGASFPPISPLPSAILRLWLVGASSLQPGFPLSPCKFDQNTKFPYCASHCWDKLPCVHPVPVRVAPFLERGLHHAHR